jgi:hypothetical protein
VLDGWSESDDGPSGTATGRVKSGVPAAGAGQDSGEVRMLSITPQRH